METRVFVGVAIVCAAVIFISAATPREAFTQSSVDAKILLLSVSTEPRMAAATTPHLRAYCDRHGYDYKALDAPLDTSRHLAWSKIVFLLRNSMNYEYFVVVDNDVVITNKEIPITAFVHRFQFDANLAQKVMVSEGADGSTFDAGITILKPTSAPLMKMLWSLATLPELKPKQWQKDWDIDVLRYYYNHAGRPVDISVVPHRTLLSFETAQDPLAVWKEGDFAMRLTAPSEEDRIKKVAELQPYIL